jgi:hypothetical protein
VRFLFESLVVLLTLSTTICAQFTKTDFSDKTADVQEIRKSMLEIERAFVARDSEPFERIFLDGYIGIRGKPVFNAREQLTAMIKWDAAVIKAGKKLDFETLSYESDHPTIHMFGDTAIVNVLKKNLWRYKESRCLTQYQSTELWLKQESRWKLTAGHMTTIQCDSMPWQPPHPAVAAIKAQSKPTRFLSPVVETEIRELLSKLTESGLHGDDNSDAFSSDFVSTAINNDISGDRALFMNALKTPTNRTSERYRDDEVFQNFGNAAMYLFRVRSLAKAGETKPEPPIVFSVIFIKQNGSWKITASHASSLQD